MLCETYLPHFPTLQVKLLFRHMEEVHRIVVPKEFKTFKTLDLFYQWLTGEEKKYNVRYIRDTTRIEKNDMKLIQMVCHRFHTAKVGLALQHCLSSSLWYNVFVH